MLCLIFSVLLILFILLVLLFFQVTKNMKYQTRRTSKDFMHSEHVCITTPTTTTTTTVGVVCCYTDKYMQSTMKGVAKQMLVRSVSPVSGVGCCVQTQR
jgi:predicted histidine transporter YuiF (NhaC family)